MIDEWQIQNWFSVHEQSEVQKTAYREVLDGALMFAATINRWMPDGEDKNMVMNSIRQNILTAELAIRYRGVESPIKLVQ